MKIVFNPFYDNEVFIKEGTNLMGTLYVGAMGLLDQLELRGAVHSNTVSNVEMTACYMEAMRKHIKGTVFEPSAKVDEMGVAEKLLQWRDALIMAGWDGKCTDKTAEKLYVLSEINNDYKCKGFADRWMIIRDLYSKHNIDLSGFEFVIDCPWEEIPFIIRQTIDELPNCGAKVTKSDIKCVDAVEKGKVQVVEFADANDAYEWIATANALPENTVVINRNNTLLNHTLFSWNKPLVKASLIDSNPSVLQLFKLGFSMFTRPLNIHNIVSYLLLPVSPLPFKLRKGLAGVLLQNGGFGGNNDWEKVIKDFKFVNDEGKETPQAKAKKSPFFSPIRADYSSGIDKQDLFDYAAKMLQWITGKLHYKSSSDDMETKVIALEVEAQLRQLKGLFSAFRTAIASMPDKIESEELDKLVARIYKPMTYCNQQAEIGSLHIIEDIRQMAEPADNLIWLDCQENDAENDTYAFLSANDRSFLKDVEIPDFAEHLNRVRSERLRLINSVKGKVTLVCSLNNGTSHLSEHPVIADVRQVYKELPIVKKESVLQLQVVENETGAVKTFIPQPSYDVESEIKVDRIESNTSLDTLINYPFDYVVKYVAKLNKPDDEQMKSTYVTLGLVAHHLLEHITNDSDKNCAEMKKLTDSNFDEYLNDAIDATGLLLRLPENSSELEIFSKILKESVYALLDIMDRLKLTPFSCELSIPDSENNGVKYVKLGDIEKFGARIDYVLKKVDSGDFVIFDFKWSMSKKYSEFLEQNIAIQLELYKQSLKVAYPEKNVIGVGYFLLPKKQLLTSDFDTYGSLIYHIERSQNAGTDLFAMIKNSYKYRLGELRRGHIEEAEEMNIIDDKTCYYANQVDEALVPLKVEEKSQGRGDNKSIVSAKKKSNSEYDSSKKDSFEDKNAEPYEISTRNQVLKNRLK